MLPPIMWIAIYVILHAMFPSALCPSSGENAGHRVRMRVIGRSELLVGKYLFLWVLILIVFTLLYFYLKQILSICSRTFPSYYVRDPARPP
ncbi:hypothetical protein BDN72DRAFT_104920 [Pluteus cervinus]|uniref:Uncharacterized protein n=1 Tax=Pluteus cervinus TaxID=181527 RepID=A0ACD3APU3_9AGAR|nr:hypothetical protein BDN72DRAFT_104920 [Pluteus cervinus]